MKAMIHAGMAIGDAAGHADCQVNPEVTLTFENRRDRFRFEQTLARLTEPLHADVIATGRASGLYNFGGVLFRLAVRQVDAP